MIKKILTFILSLLCFTQVFSQSQDLKKRFIKGNISEKTAAVREASGVDAIWLSNEAMIFALENKNILGNDRDLDALAVAAVLSISPDILSASTDSQKDYFLDKFINLFSQFNESNTVQIAVLSKLVMLKDSINTGKFTDLLNDYISQNDISKIDSSTAKSIINTLGIIGNNNSFIVCYSLWNNPKYESFYPEIENCLSKLIEVSMDEVIYIINSKNINKIAPLFDKIIKKSNISQNFLCEIAENLLIATNIILDKTSSNSNKEVILNIQLESIDILSRNKWTRSSQAAIDFFFNTMDNYMLGTLSEDTFITVIKSLNNVAPIASIAPLTKFLEELNSLTEKGKPVSDKLIKAVIQTLGAIGDKSAFDSLLAVTYLNYPESVLSAAREALAGLKW